MSEEKNPKNWYIRLKEDFFDTKEIKMLKNMDNGKDYIILLLQLRLLTINTKGKLQYSNTIPYNDKMLADITSTNIDIVRSGVRILQELNFISMLDDGTLYLEEVQSLIGYSSKYAEQKAKYRAKKKLEEEGHLIGHCPTRDKSIENRDKSIKNKDIEKNNSTYLPPNNNKKSLFEIMEEEWGRTLTPIEYETISNWEDNDQYRYAIKESVINRARNIKYIEAIVRSLKEKDLNTTDEIEQANNKWRKKYETKEMSEEQKEIFDYNWLEDEE